VPCPEESALQAFVDGSASEAEAESIASHLDGCRVCQTLLGALQPLDAAGEGRIGRYLLRRVVGAGGMGVVYEAFDPDLGRTVALKVLRTDLAANISSDRLIEEARAMARLSHPNVVPVHDIGRAGDQIYLVMDLVDGVSLRQWLAIAARSLDAICDVFLAAAEGLGAAHGAGIVHRDFKPENVLVGRDGRARVTDFGLAVVAESAGAAGRREGSPAYMAPEQRAGQACDSRADQYAFCVALAEAVEEGRHEPRWLRAVLARGRAAESARRFPSMGALIAAITSGRVRKRRRRWVAIAAVAASAITVSVFWAGIRRERSRTRCEGGSERVAAIWNPTIAARIATAFSTTGSPLARTTWPSTQRALDAYAEGWLGAHRRTCEATRVHGEQSEALLDRRMGCLAERLQRLDGVVQLLARVDAATLERLPALLSVLEPVSVCETAMYLAQVAPPAPEQANAVEEVQAKVARAAARLSAGHYQEGGVLADEALARAEASRYLPVVAEAALWRGVARGRLGDTAAARDALERAVSAATAAHTEPIAVRAWVQLMHFVGADGHRYTDGHHYDEYAEAALRGMPEAVELDAERLAWLSTILAGERRYEEALAVSRRQLPLVETKLGPRHRLVAAALDRIAGQLAAMGRSRDALSPEGRACALLVDDLGEIHPQVALCRNNLAALHANLGEHARAIELKREALAGYARLPGHPGQVAMTHRNLARSMLALDRLSEAEAEIAQAAAIEPGDATEGLRGELLRRQGRAAAALAIHRRLAEQARTESPAEYVSALVDLCETLSAAHHDAEAAIAAAEAATVAKTAYGEGSYQVGEPRLLEAEALIASGRLEAAHAAVEDVYTRLIGPMDEPAAMSAPQLDPLVLARVLFAAARVLPESAHAEEWTTRAEGLVAVDPRARTLRAALASWRAHHRRSTVTASDPR
jgi:tetratricopeptide (TPR) repeat protein